MDNGWIHKLDESIKYLIYGGKRVAYTWAEVVVTLYWVGDIIRIDVKGVKKDAEILGVKDEK